MSFDTTVDIPDKDGRSALMWAAERGHYNIVKTMIERKVDINTQDNLGVTGIYITTCILYCIIN